VTAAVALAAAVASGMAAAIHAAASGPQLQKPAIETKPVAERHSDRSRLADGVPRKPIALRKAK
jgi:hypothetical protein